MWVSLITYSEDGETTKLTHLIQMTIIIIRTCIVLLENMDYKIFPLRF